MKNYESPGADVHLKTWEILSRLPKKQLEKIDLLISLGSRTMAMFLETGEPEREADGAGTNFYHRRLLKRELVGKITLQIYAELNQRSQYYFTGSETLIVPALAMKPHGMCLWQELENELASQMRPSTFAQRIRDLTQIHAVVFVIRGTGNEKLLVIPEESLPMVREEFSLPPHLPAEVEKDFGKLLSPSELRKALNQIPNFALSTPNPREIFELRLVKYSGKTGTIRIPATATFEELHRMLLKFAGWDEDHLHEFRVRVVDPEPDTIVIDGLTPDGEPMDTSRPGDYREDKVQLGQLLVGKNNTLAYINDFGDRKQVQVKVLQILPKEGRKEEKRGADRQFPRHRSDLGRKSNAN